MVSDGLCRGTSTKNSRLHVHVLLARVAVVGLWQDVSAAAAGSPPAGRATVTGGDACSLWPMPHTVQVEGGPVALSTVTFAATAPSSAVRETLAASFARYESLLLGRAEPTSGTGINPTAAATALHVDAVVLTDSLELGVNTDYAYNVSLQPNTDPTVRQATVVIRAQTVYGAIYGLETLSQMVQRGAGPSPPTLCARQIRVVDWAAFRWRGLMLDTGRRFFPVPLVKQILDAMGYSKMNVLHLHFGEEGGFRVQSLSFPELTAAVRHYTQPEIVELVEYARLRGVRIVPEIDLPMHSSDLQPLEQYGLEFCNSSVRVEVFNNPRTNGSVTVLKRLLSEMMDLFPDPVFHIGADEVVVAEKYPEAGKCTTANLRDLQRQLLSHVYAHGKQPMAWHDIFVSTGAAQGWEGSLILDTWHKFSSKASVAPFGASNATALGFEAVESSGMYIVPNAHGVGANWTSLWTDIGAGFGDEQRHKMLGGEVSFWGNDYCSWIGHYGGHTMCDLKVGAGGAPPIGASMNSSTVDLSHAAQTETDERFGRSSMGILWPATAAAAGSFWHYTDSGGAATASGAAHNAYLRHATRLAARNISGVCLQDASCAGGCTVTTRCGRPY